MVKACINNQLKCIFMHINKTAGLSVARALGFRKGRRHFLVRRLKRQVSKYVWDNYFKFTFVRNPWDRWVSMYHWRRDRRGLNYEFNEWTKKICTRPEHKFEQPQMFWLKDDQGNIPFDFIGKFENLHEDFDKICNQLHTKSQLPHTHKTEHGHYSMYYTDETRDLVAETCREEIEYFNYEFEDQR